jgi:hypothetical protein
VQDHGKKSVGILYTGLVTTIGITDTSNIRNIQIKTTCRLTRENSGTAQITFYIPSANTLTFQNSFYCRSSRTFNCLPSVLRQSNLSINQFKCNPLVTIRKCLKIFMALVCHKLSKQSVLNVIHVVPCLVSLLNRVVNNHHLCILYK